MVKLKLLQNMPSQKKFPVNNTKGNFKKREATKAQYKKKSFHTQTPSPFIKKNFNPNPFNILKFRLFTIFQNPQTKFPKIFRLKFTQAY